MLKRTCSALMAVFSLTVPAHAQSLNAEIAAAETAAAAYADARVAKREGWKTFGGDEPLMGQHWYHPSGPDYTLETGIDPRRPSNLMYSDINGETRLVALSYNVRIAPGEPLPRGFTGSADKWHVHDMGSALAAATSDRPLLRALTQGWLKREVAERDGRTRLAMVHLWLIPNPEGRFASHNPTLAYLDLGLPADWAADLDAARGVALASPDGCDETLDGRLWIANVDRSTQRQLKAVCRQLAEYVRGEVSNGKSALNAMGRGAWKRMEQEIDARLTMEQKMRIAAMSEHGDHH